MRHLMIAGTAVLALAACTTVTTVSGPNGRAAYSIVCGPTTYCLQKAGQLCPRGYDRLSMDQTPGMMIPAGYNVISTTNTTYFVECK